MIRLTWTTPTAGTALHAAIAQRDRVPLIDSQVASKVDRAAAGWSREELMDAAGDVATGEGAPPRAESTRMTGLAASLPDPSDELAYRVRPLREQWEARGPGLLRAIVRRTEPIGLDAATVALVLPVVGGHGVPLPKAGAVLLEAVLANPNPALPEVVRLGWLLAQLTSDANPFALAPAVLAAAEEVELASADQPTLAEALLAWRLVADSQTANERASQLWGWWSVCVDESVPWQTTLQTAPE